MSYVLRAQEIASVSRLDGTARYRHFIKRVADWEQVGTLAGQAADAPMAVWPQPATPARWLDPWASRPMSMPSTPSWTTACPN